MCRLEVTHYAIVRETCCSCAQLSNKFSCQMFVNGVQAISSRLENLSLDYQRTMQPKSERPPVCPKTQLPHFQVTPSDAGQKKDGSPQTTENPWLLKPQHEIPATPPPQTKQAGNFFQQRIG